MSADAEGDIGGHPASPVLHAAWLVGDRSERRSLIEGLRPPGPVALRSRYRLLLDPEAPSGPCGPGLSSVEWNTNVSLENQGDIAVLHNDADSATRIFTELLGREPSLSLRVVTVNARVGLGDVASARGDIETAVREYETALEIADDDGYRFGRLRALVGLGHLTLLAHSARTARTRFEEAWKLANALGDPLFAANCALGVSECAERLGELEASVEHSFGAYTTYREIRSPIGEGNAALRAAVVLHRLKRRPEAGEWYGRAHTAYTAAGNPMGLTNALSGLGDVHLDAYEIDDAERCYQESLRVADRAGLRLSRANALQDLARVSRARADWDDAVVRFRASLAAYLDLDEIIGVSNAYHRLAEAYEELGRGGDALSARMDALVAVEEYRATHRDDRSQREYRDRFRHVYAQALDAATRHGSPAAFAVVADCLAGRRLAGLFEEAARSAAASAEQTLLQELLVRADQRLIRQRHGKEGLAPEGEPPSVRRERIVGLLNAVGSKHVPAPQGETTLEDLLATVYLPPREEGDALLDALPENCHMVQTLLDPVDGRSIRWLWREPDGTCHLGTTELAENTVGLLKLLGGDGDDRAGLRLADLAPLHQLIPPPVNEALAGRTGTRLVLVPVGELWLVPWSAVPLMDGRVLGECAAYVLCPSLTVQRQLSVRGGRRAAAGARQVDLWRSPFVRHHQLSAFRSDPHWDVTVLGTPAQTKQRLRSGGEAMVVSGHGRPTPGLGHYLELDQDEWLLPVDLVGANSPELLVFIACWAGAVPGHGPTDPLSLATLALAAGSSEIMATVGELADSVPASLYVEHVLDTTTVQALPDALLAATRWMLSQEYARSERVHHWAPVVPLGTFYPAPSTT
ncbi:tetratricopeptide repeat protein [Streptomyces microflavus]|uniref:tetratricopeptide repeat protein n=1 Tax=Streptomyces TaxID=1883 RepID=UPI001A999DA6|nr:tetratricopeptide repeat protein [Streptomyces sp. CA-256286]QTA36125.1 Tetratricopeptide repeat protein [Streptomyces sp. CA-256286]